ncbi:MAG: toprim domain-containing protein, partial [Patescibacteria group bacterium]|nr:toprim domain-containing protein [Patescibacteria group bacterium]
LTLSGKGAIREKELLKRIEKGLADSGQTALKEVVLALSATSEGEHTADRVRELLSPYRDRIRVSALGRGLSTGSELEYSDAETVRAALRNRHES